MDYKYKEGTTADCGLNYCCREESETGTGSVKAGKFGARTYRCDVPVTTVESVLDAVVSHNPDYLFWTGDNTAHDDPFVSQDEVNAELDAVISVVAKKLEGLDLTVSIGNHDTFPNGQWDFTTEGPSFPGRTELKQWVPESEWARWDEHGYYVKDLHDLNSRIISLNTESCDFHNQALWNQLADANQQIQWLESTLREVEQMGWTAILVGHIPDECSHEYTERFRALMDRFQKTIRFNMMGHVHTDIYKMVGSMRDAKDPIGVFQVCGAITTWLGNNPAYCVYELDKATMLPVSRKTYYFDLDEANETGTPEWKLLTDWTQDLGLKDLSPSEMKLLTDRMEADEMTTVDFLNRARRQPGGSSSCDEACMADTIC